MIGRRRHNAARRGFTLLEALIAATVVAAMVIATSMALTSGHQYGQLAQDEVQATLAAEALLAEVLTHDYADLSTFDGHEEQPGTMMTPTGVAYPDAYGRIGRRVSVRLTTLDIPDPPVRIEGQEITVESYSSDGMVLCTLVRFVPEPAS